MERITKSRLSHKTFFMDIGADCFCFCFLAALGFVFLIFAAPETGLTMDEFRGGSGSRTHALLGGNHVQFQVCKLLNGGWLIA